MKYISSILIAILCLLSNCSPTLQVEDYAIDAYSVNESKFLPTRTYLKLFERDSAWLINRTENFVVRYEIDSSFVVNIKEDKNILIKVEIIRMKNLTRSKELGGEVIEYVSIGLDIIALWVYNGGVIRFHVKHTLK